MDRKLKLIVIVALVVFILLVTLTGIRTHRINTIVKNTDIAINTELFDLCEYLYDTNQSQKIYETYSLVFKNKNFFTFFESVGLNEEETLNYIQKWGARYLIASCDVSKENIAIADISSFVLKLEEYNQDSVNEFIELLDNEIKNVYGLKINLMESFELRRFLNCFGESVEITDVSAQSKKVCFGFISGKYSSIGDFKSADTFSWKEEGLKISNSVQGTGMHNAFDYFVRYTVIVLCLLIFVISIVFIRKKKKLLVSIISILCSCVVLFVSFFVTDIKNIAINNNIDSKINLIKKNYMPDDLLSYNLYYFECEDYYGTISFSLTDKTQKEKELSKNNWVEKYADDKNAHVYSYIACERDNYGLPNYSVGMATIYREDVRVSIKYIYKNTNVPFFVKCITFDQYLSKPTIDLNEVIESINVKSMVIIDKTI